MTWEETIKFIRTKPEYKDLVKFAYFEEELQLNVERFRKSEEYIETLRLIKKIDHKVKSILDVGSGNGISSIAFALDGFDVTTCEPDPSDTIGAGAIQILKSYYKLENLNIVQDFAENLQLSTQFDMVYVRQAMHHAYDLKAFVKNLSKYLKFNGLFVTVRDHVVYDDLDKQKFLESHPLQKFYGGENAFTIEDYRNAIRNADLEIKYELSHFDSVINYFPMTRKQFNSFKSGEFLKEKLKEKIGILSYIPGLHYLYKLKNAASITSRLNEKNNPCRMYSFFNIKK